MSEIIEITGTVKNLFKGCPKPDGWFGCFFRADGYPYDIRVTGTTQLSVGRGVQFSLLGSFTDSSEEAFNAMCVELVMTRTTMIRYLSGKLFPGVGVTTATKIVDAFGSKTLSIIGESPDQLKALGIPDAMFETICAGVNSRNVHHQLIKDYPMLKPKMIDELIVTYGKEAVKMLQTKPYDVADACDSIPFRMAHMIAGMIPLDLTTRIQECLQQAVSETLEQKGDVCLDLSDGVSNAKLVDHAHQLVGYNVDRQYIVDAFLNMGALARLEVIQIEGQYFVYSKRSYQAETKTADYLSHLVKSKPVVTATTHDIMDYITDYEEKTGQELDGQQRLAIINAIKRRASVITGGPGRGKTTILGCLIYCWRQISNRNVILSAPTGKAARRLTEAVSDSGLFAETIMRQIIMANKGDGRSKREAEQKRKGALIIVDECSMIGLVTAAKMLALYENSQIVFVGDRDQLPSIEAGQFFRDLCESGVIPVTELLVCYRASDGKILIDNADKINMGDDFVNLTFDPSAFMFTPFDQDAFDYQAHLVSQYEHYINAGITPDQICLLCATNNGATGVSELNSVLQDRLNPLNSSGAPTDRGFPAGAFVYWYNKKAYAYRVGDRVMQTKNHWDAIYDYHDVTTGAFIDSGTGIFNGDCGTVLEYVDPIGEDPYLIIQMDDGRRFNIEPAYADELKLAYAMTIHKSQGCEYQVVLFSAQCSLSQSNWAVQNNFLTRNLLYTAVTRSKKVVSLVGSQRTIELCLATPVAKRQSNLQYRLKN